VTRKAGARLRVLIADGDSNARRSLATDVHRLGHSIATARTGQEAWDDFLSLRPDVVFVARRSDGTDAIDGLDLCRRVRESADTECFVVIMIYEGDDHDRYLAADAGADDCVVAPVSREDLRPLLASAWRRLDPASSATASLADADADPIARLFGLRPSPATT
jgi:adenylate cyclase